MELGEARMLTERWKNKDKWKLTLHRERTEGIEPPLVIFKTSTFTLERKHKHGIIASTKILQLILVLLNSLRDLQNSGDPLWPSMSQRRGTRQPKSSHSSKKRSLFVCKPLQLVKFRRRWRRIAAEKSIHSFLIKLCRVIYAVWISYGINTMKNAGTGPGREKRSKEGRQRRDEKLNLNTL